MAQAGQEIQGIGHTLLLVSIDDELLVMEAAYEGSGTLPPEHLHPHQAEHFDVLEGELRTVIGTEERRYGQGETFDVPAGTPHQMGAERPARVRWEVRPALRTAEFFERLYGDGPDSPRDAASAEAFFAEFSDEFRLTGT